MSEFSGGTLYAQDIEQPPTPEDVASIVNGPEAEYAPEPLSTQIVNPVDTAPEMSESHPDINTIDIKQFSAGALIKVCPHYAKMAEINPELAKAKATEVVQRMQERETMQDKGMDAATIKQQQFAAMKARLQAKAKAKEKAAAEAVTKEPEVKPVQTLTTAEHTTTKTQDTANQIKAENLQPTPDATKVIPDNSRPHTDVRRTAPKAEISPEPSPPDTEESNHVDVPLSTSASIPQPVKAKKAEDIIPLHEPLVVEQVVIQPIETVPAKPDIEQPGTETEPTPLHLYELPFPSEEDIIAEIANEQSQIDEPEDELRAVIEAEYAAIIDASQQETELPEKSPFTELEPSIETADTPGEEAKTYRPMPELEHTTAVVESTDATTIPPDTEPEQTMWSELLEQEPIKIHASFSEALRTAAAIPEQVVTFMETTDVDQPVVLAEAIQEVDSPPVIATTVIEQLGNLEFEEKEAIAPLLKEAMEATHIFHTLSTTDVEPQVVESVRAEIKKLVTALFEELHITYEPEDMEHFIAILLQANLQPLESGRLPIDLQNEGTHEAKSPFTQLVDTGLTDIQEAGKRLLGKLVLLSTGHHILPECELVA